MNTKQPTNRFARLAWTAFTLATTFALFPQNASAATIIKQPGNHPQYSWELEPHLAVDWDNHWYNDDGFRPGVHAAIPIMQQGPIPTINNNMAIKFGFDLIFHGGCDGRYRDWGAYDCSATSILLPIALQWNFYITDIITVFGEPGLAIRHMWWEQNNCPNGAPGCDWDGSDTYLLPYFGAGAKFMFGRTAG
ncbi:MAG: hypothetical protein QM784_13125, partial [Polyangiaceae bacterium]